MTLVGVRVLVVEDDVDNRDALEALLALEGAEVRTAASAELAMQLLDTRSPQVVASDIALPNRDGYWLLRQLRAWQQRQGVDVKTLAVTAHASTSDRTRALDAGFDSYLCKPF